jgi:RimJ/RimL family protein N-acetyltransferase
MPDIPERAILLRGSRLGLAAQIPDDLPAFARWNQNLEFTALMGTPGEFHTLEDRRKFFERNGRFNPDGMEFAIVRLEDGALVGFGGLFDITRALTASMFVAIDPALWGRRDGTEATRLICEYGFLFRSLHSIKVEVNGYNARALRVYERIGFKHAGRLRGVLLLNGIRHDQIIMDLLRDELTPQFAALAV